VKKQRSTPENAVKELDHLRARVAELEETLRAIRSGEVDAVLVSGSQGDQVFTLQGAEHPYRLLVEQIDEGAATLSDDGTVLYSNKSFAKIFDVPLQKFIGAQLQKFVPGKGAEALQKLITGAKRGSTRGEIRLNIDRGRPRTIRLTLSPNKELGVETICAVATELTEMVETNEALRVTESSLRQLSGRLLQLQDEERRRIARDLHDVTGQKLVVLTMGLDRLGRVAAMHTPELRELFRDCRDNVEKISEEIRTLSYVLHPPLLDECGLASAVRWYAEGFEQRSGIKVQVEADADVPRLSSELETALFRVVQESLTNVHRYSGSSQAKIRISSALGEVRLEIIDHGKGLKAGTSRASPDGSARLGVGIPGMRERLHQLGGTLDVDFGAHGTRVLATVPMRLAAEEKPAGARQSADGKAVAAAAEDISRRRILIAEDHEVMRRGLRGLIETHEEWAVCGEAVEGNEAVRKAKELSPDLVIMDINLPGLSGIDAAMRIRRENSLMKVLFFTVHDSEQVMREIVDVGGHGYVAKSRAGEDLVAAVQQILAGKTFFPSLSMTAARMTAARNSA
jgi:two-component system, NarL family, sensor kinase